MLLNAIWMATFVQANLLGFFIGLIEIIPMALSAYYMMMQSMRTSVNIWEFVVIRVGMSIYSGWLAGATTLNFTFAFKSAGMADSQDITSTSALKWLMFMDEEAWGIFMLSFLVIAYGVLSIYVTNPLYGLVYNYILIAIWVELSNNSDKASTLKGIMPLLLGLHVCLCTIPVTVKAILNRKNTFKPGLLTNIGAFGLDQTFASLKNNSQPE